MSNFLVEIQCSGRIPSVKENEIRQWVDIAREQTEGDICIRFVDCAESYDLNHRFRRIKKPTNVLAFPAEQIGVLGDLAICSPVADKEASEQCIEPRSHYAHLVVHGVLHLRGFDHLDQKDAIEMEAKEIRILNLLGIDNPYREYERN